MMFVQAGIPTHNAGPYSAGSGKIFDIRSIWLTSSKIIFLMSIKCLPARSYKQNIRRKYVKENM